MGRTRGHRQTHRPQDRAPPPGGPLLLDCETFIGLDHHHQRLKVLTPADQESRERLQLLQVLGLQKFA
ncbi:hypothetical protein [Streptomyces tendae]|uniref:hypothetical protein n=1 Tax=Streptomyces tendae TaxID=1932 RepID=UPI0036A94797